MTYLDDLRDGADTHFKEWLRALADPADETARAAAWGLRLDLGGLSPEDALIRVAEAMKRHAGPHRLLYAASIAGGPHDDEDAIESMMETVEAIISDRAPPEFLREAARCNRIVERIRRGDWSEGDVAWLDERASTICDSLVMLMKPFGEERIVEIERRVVTARTPQIDFWTRREIPAGKRHLVLKESLRGRENETRHSLLSAYLHTVVGDGGATEFLAPFEEPERLAG